MSLILTERSLERKSNPSGSVSIVARYRTLTVAKSLGHYLCVAGTSTGNNVSEVSLACW
jgi:hypothetical protein